MSLIFKRKYNPVVVILLCSLLVLLIMQPWNLYFRNDDFEHIPNENLIIQGTFLRPVSNFFLAWDKWIFNKIATGYFFTTYILHTLCSISIYFLTREVLLKYNLNLPSHTAVFTAIIFLFYPFHAEPLFWVIGRVSIIAALFTILSLYFYLKKDEHQKYFFAALLTFLTALFTYESMWNVLFFYCLISFFRIRDYPAFRRKEYLHVSIFLLAFAIYISIRFLSLNTITGGYSAIDSNIKQPVLLIINLVKLVGRNFTPPFYNQFFSLAFFFTSAIIYSVVLVAMFRRNKRAAWLMLFLVVGIISGVITAAPLGIDTHRNESERYIYYSSFFFCFFLSVATSLFKKRRWQYAINCALILSGIAGLIVYQANYRYASLVVKNSLDFTNNYKDFSTAFFIDVPEEYRGALIFRTCLHQGINWIAPDCKFQKVIVVTQTKEAAGSLPYHNGEKSWEEMCMEKSSVCHNGTYTLTDSLNRVIPLNKNDVVFWYAKDGFYKINPPK